jgi:phosphosulfolactate phosphohydrolase-like enzyme
VVFTTSNGSARLLQASGAASVHFGTTTNAGAVVQLLADQPHDVVLIPAGKVGQPGYDAQEDWVAAAAIAMQAGVPIGEGALQYRDTRQLIELDGVLNLFLSAPHADELRKVGLAADITLCARMNTSHSVPTVSNKPTTYGLILGRPH